MRSPRESLNAFVPCHVAGMALCAALLVCGCSSTHSTIELDAQHPSIRQTSTGVMIGDQCVKPTDVASYLDDFDVPHDRTIHILLDDDVKDLRPARFLMACLARAGYTRPVLVTKRHAEAVATGRKKPAGRGAAPAAQHRAVPKKIRYKRASE